MKTDMLDDSVSFHTNTNTHRKKYLMKADMLDDSVSFHTNTNTHTKTYLMKTDMLNDSVSEFSIQNINKSMLQILYLYNGLFSDVFRKKLQYNFPKMRGGSKAVWNFSENSSDLVA